MRGGHVDDIAEACRAVLDSVQEMVEIATAEPWPGPGGSSFPVVRVTSTHVELSYEHAGSVLLALPPIPR